jgi:hypothetical protein
VREQDSGIKPVRDQDSGIKPVREQDSGIEPLRDQEAGIEHVREQDSGIEHVRDQDSGIEPVLEQEQYYIHVLHYTCAKAQALINIGRVVQWMYGFDKKPRVFCSRTTYICGCICANTTSLCCATVLWKCEGDYSPPLHKQHG